MYNMMASAASPREQREQRGSSPRGQASNAAASRNRVKLYGCNVSWRFKKAQYRQKNRMKWRAKTRTRRFIEGFTRSVRYFFGIHTFSQRAFYPFLPCQTRISVFYVHTSFVAALNRRGEFIGTVALDLVSIKLYIYFYIQDILMYL